MNSADAVAVSEEISALLTSISIIMIAGLAGGFAAYLSEDAAVEPEAKRAPPLRYLMLGMIAAACVPLFLSLVRSDILAAILTNREGDRLQSYLVFVGLCLIAAFLGRRFIDSLSQRVLDQVKEATATAVRAENKAEDAQETALEVADERSAQPVSEQNLELMNARDDSEPIPSVSEKERAVLQALTKMTFRTATGAAAEAGIPRAAVGEILDALHAKGLAQVAQSPTTRGVRWKISDRGIAALHPEG